MARGDYITALRLLLRVRNGEEGASELRGAAINIAHNAGLNIRDFERALDLCLMQPPEYFAHERAVASILEETDAPIRARLIEMSVEPGGAAAERPALTAWLERLSAVG